MEMRTAQDSESGASPVLWDGRAVQPDLGKPPATAGGTSSALAAEIASDRDRFIASLGSPPSTAPDPSDAGMVPGEIPERRHEVHTGHETPASVSGGREIAAAPPAPRTYTIDGDQLGLSGQFLITDYYDGVTLAWRPDSYGSTLWGVPVDGEPDVWSPEALAKRVRPLTDDIGRGTRP